MNAHRPLLRLGTRASPLALAQASQVQALLAQHLGCDLEAIEVVGFTTDGDRITDRPLAEVGGKGLFTKELDVALVDGRIDLAVHSMKDVATRLPPGIVLAAILPREDVRERLLPGPGLAEVFASAAAGALLDALPLHARLGTSSLRRAAQMLARRPDLNIVPFRGNVGTRLAKLANGQADATLLAAAGLNRLGLSDLGLPVEVDEMLPAPAQGAVGIAVRDGSLPQQQAAVTQALARVADLDDRATSIAVSAERAFLAGLDGSCRTPIAALATLAPDGTLMLHGEIIRPDGAARAHGERRGLIADARALGADLAAELRAASPIPLGQAAVSPD